jgi:hypothetical protein
VVGNRRVGVSQLSVVEVAAASERTRFVAGGEPGLCLGRGADFAGGGRTAHLRFDPARIDRGADDVGPAARDRGGEDGVEKLGVGVCLVSVPPPLFPLEVVEARVAGAV